MVGVLPAPEGAGPEGVRLVTSDKCLGVVEAAASVFPDARWQRCVVHFERNILSAVPREKMAEVAAMLKAVYASEDRPAAEGKAEQVAAKLTGMRLTSAATVLRAGGRRSRTSRSRGGTGGGCGRTTCSSG